MDRRTFVKSSLVAGGGALLWWLTPRHQNRELAFYPSVGLDGAGLIAGGRF
jgi:hypothetical protein